ncbi:MAG: DUF4190 domain-containing protein [Planctomycetota bacterium]|nr:DUF4190 domain-containing protein [Planctomycetota bacterium]
MVQHKSVDPYAAPWDTPEVGSRMSVLAIAALILALVCFVPGFGLAGVFFGLIALVLIVRSGGRLHGKGAAIAAIVFGTIFTMVWAGLGVGALQAVGLYQTRFAKPHAEKLLAFDAGDDAALRSLLTPDVAAQVTDAHLAAFRSAYQAELGKFVSVPEKPIELVRQAVRSESLMKATFQSPPVQAPTQTKLPLFATFEKGEGVVIFVVDTTGAQGNNTVPLASQIELLYSKGVIELSPPTNALPLPPAVPAPEAAPAPVAESAPAPPAPAPPAPAGPAPASPAPAPAPADAPGRDSPAPPDRRP